MGINEINIINDKNNFVKRKEQVLTALILVVVSVCFFGGCVKAVVFLYTKALEYNEISIIPYGKYFIYRLKLENYTSYSLDVGIFISSNKYNFADYQLFLVALPAGTDTSMIDSAVFGNEKTSIRSNQTDINIGVASGNKNVIISTVY